MKSLHLRNVAGNCKLKGKLTKMLSCGCCDVQNWKWRERLKEADKEIKERGPDGKAAVC